MTCIYQFESILLDALEIVTVIEKTREIYYIDNVKFHLDTVNGLGSLWNRSDRVFENTGNSTS